MPLQGNCEIDEKLLRRETSLSVQMSKTQVFNSITNYSQGAIHAKQQEERMAAKDEFVHIFKRACTADTTRSWEKWA